MVKKIANLKVLYLALIALFAIPSIIHITNSGFLLNKDEYFHIFQNNTLLNGVIYCSFFLAMFAIYAIILKKRKTLFNSNKELIIFILLASVLFSVILPITSSDILSYATTGEIQCKYGANPYYDTIKNIKSVNDTSNNEILNSITLWDDQLVIYGPLWSIICGIISFFSFSKVSIVLMLFKLMAVAIHICNCIIIYKLTKKRLWVIFYGLNPYILFETLSNVHNDLYLVFFTLLGLYFFIKKKNLLVSLIFLACATCIKYVTVLLVPILLIYYYRNENVGKRILKCIKSGLVYSVFVIGLYLVYLRSFDMIFYVLIQQSKYRESIQAALFVLARNLNNPQIISFASKFITIVFIGAYISFIARMLLKKDIRFKEIMSNWNTLLLFFILVYISNLCVWYFVWLFATTMWQNSRNISIVMYLPLCYELLVSKYFFIGVEAANASYAFAIIAIICLVAISVLNKYRKINILE